MNYRFDKPEFKEINLSNPFSPINRYYDDLDAIDSVMSSIHTLQEMDSMSIEEEIMIERNNEIKKLEQELIDIGEIMKDLHEMVVDQGEAINTVEQEVENTVLNVEAGLSNLENAEAIQIKTRRTKVATVTGAVIGGVALGGIGGLAFGITPGLISGGLGSAGGAITGFASQ